MPKFDCSLPNTLENQKMAMIVRLVTFYYGNTFFGGKLLKKFISSSTLEHRHILYLSVESLRLLCIYLACDATQSYLSGFYSNG